MAGIKASREVVLEQIQLGLLTGAVASRIVCETDLKAVLWQLMGVSSADGDVAHYLGIHDLADNVLRAHFIESNYSSGACVDRLHAGRGGAGGGTLLVMRTTRRYFGMLYLFLS